MTVGVKANLDEKTARQLGLVLAHRAHHGEAPLMEQPSGQLVGGEKVVARHVARAPQALGQVHHHPGALIPLGGAARGLARVDMKFKEHPCAHTHTHT